MPQLDLIQDLAVVLASAGAAAWLCQRLGISVVVGYLVAGILVGPFTPPAAFVTGEENVHRLANLGLIFVMFFVGLSLSLKRLQALGLPVIAATAVTALLVLTASRATAAALGFDLAGGLFLGGILVVSSSAIIDKVLSELDATREPHAQFALGITVLEDLVAVVMLAILGSVATARSEQAPALAEILVKMAAFILVVLVASLLAVPRLLRALRRTAGVDVQTVCTAGVLLAVAWVAARAGYSVALGAFLLGTILGSTQHKARLERSFAPVRDLFAAVFFVSMGMLFDVRLVATEWPWVLALTGFALLTRALAATVGLTLVGQPLGSAAQTGLSLLPLGEFSFVIAQLGVSSGLMPPAFYPATVGAALITTLLSPPLMRRGAAVGRALGKREPQLLKAWRTLLQRVAEALQRRRERQPLIKLVSGRVVQLVLEVSLVVSVVALSRLLYDALAATSAGAALRGWLPLVYWASLGLVLLVPLLAIWRALGALGMILGEASGGGRLQPLVEHAVQTGGTAGVLLLCAAFVPGWSATPLMLLPIVAFGAAVALLMRSQLVRWYAQAQSELKDNLAEAEAPQRKAPAPALSNGTAERARAILEAPFGLKVHEHSLSDLSPAVGQSIGATALRRRFGCTIAGIERQGFSVPNPGADAPLYPNDTLLLVGTPAQIEEAERWLSSEAPRPGSGWEQLVTETLRVPEGATCAGRTLRELAVANRFGVQVLGISRGSDLIQTGSGDPRLEAGDSVLVLGTREQNAAFRECLGAGTDAPPPAPSNGAARRPSAPSSGKD